MRDERNYRNFEKFIKIVINLDDKLYERIIKKCYDQSKDRAKLIYKSTMKYVKSKKTTSYMRNSKYTDFALMKFDMTQQHKEKNFKNKKNKKKLYYECKKTDHFVRNCRNESVMSRRQLNIMLKKIFKIDDTEKIDNKTKILKISSNDEYCIVNSMTKLQKIINAASTKRINKKIEKFKHSLIFYSNCIKTMFKSNLKYNYNNQTK